MKEGLKITRAALLVGALSVPGLAVSSPVRFVRGSVSNGKSVSVTDAVLVLRLLFEHGEDKVQCLDAADANDDGRIDLSDAIYILSYLFVAGPEPAAPYPECGLDPTEDALGCARQSRCAAREALIFVVDRSGSFQDLPVALREVSQQLDYLSESAEFGLVFFDRDVQVFPADGAPALASDEAKAAAGEFLGSIQNGSGSCPKAGLLRALEMASAATAERLRVTYLGDGGGTCPGAASEEAYLDETVSEVTEKNVNRYRLNTLGVGSYLDALAEKFLKQLAARNGGTYARILP